MLNSSSRMATARLVGQAATMRQQQQQLGSFFFNLTHLSPLPSVQTSSKSCFLTSCAHAAAAAKGSRPLLTSASSSLPARRTTAAAAAASPAAAYVVAAASATSAAPALLPPHMKRTLQPAAGPLQQRQPRNSNSSNSGVAALGPPAWCTYTAKRTYLHFNRTLPEDFELPADTMPTNVANLLSKDPKQMDFFENYWYWKLRGEATVLDPESLPKKSYKQLARDMGMQVVSEETEHMVGLLELYEHLKTATFVGPFGTIDKPVLCPSVTTDRIVGCTGGAGDKEHVPLWFRCREGFLYRCGECDQIFMLVRVFYSLPDGKDPFPVDPDVDDVFDAKLLEKGEKMWNSAEYVHWPAGHAAYSQLFLEGKWGNPVPQKLSQELRAVEA